MTDQYGGGLPHLWVRDRAEDRQFSRSGGGDPKIRDVEYRAHGAAIQRQVEQTFEGLDQRRSQAQWTIDELNAQGVTVVLEGAATEFPLKIDSLDRMSAHRKTAKRPMWLLLSVQPASDEQPERAAVWVSDEYRSRFLRLFESYVAERTKSGHPKNRELVANLGRFREAVLADLWQSDGAPPADGVQWWEVWLRPTDDAFELLRRFAEVREAELSPKFLRFNDRTIAWLRSTWADLQDLTLAAVPLTEIRRPEFVGTLEDLTEEERDDLAEELAGRIEVADADAPAVCHLDTGVRRTHKLLEGSLASADMHSIVGTSTDDQKGHGTEMAGLALFGPLEPLISGTQPIVLEHRLESVKFLPDAGGHDPVTYGLVTAEATAAPEIASDRRRVFCMPVSANPERIGEPTLWSASVDALAAGVDVGVADDGIELLGAPEPDAARLFVVSAGNVRAVDFQADYRSACDSSPIEDPAHAWNALTVGASTELCDVPTDPSYAGWRAVGVAGDISPHSRTSLTFAGWPIKPDICMEGGNVLMDGAGVTFDGAHPGVSCRTTDRTHDLAFGESNATSAATAQAARLAALASARYPDYWPETLRGLLVHHADWTPVMRGEIERYTGKRDRLRLLRRYGWGVPSEDEVLESARNAVTLVAQDSFVPFEGKEFASRIFRLHQLPWPADELAALGGADVSLRITLSYFIEPSASRRGWRRRYAYPSHGLRFELQAPTETLDQFLRRVNREAQLEEAGRRPSGAPDRWVVGPNQRNLGSLHQDIWEGTGADLAQTGVVAVHPVGGWWKNRKQEDRMGLPVRYSLITSLRTSEADVDLYTPIATEIGTPIAAAIPAT